MKKLHINWQDGMKVSKSHFQGMEYAIRNELLDHIGVYQTSYNYGLIPQQGTTSSCDLFFKLDQSDQIVLNLLTCHAVTSGGAVIAIEPQQQHLDEYRIDKTSIFERLKNSDEQALYVVVNIDIYNRKRYGENLSGENPPRQPYTIPNTYLSICNYQEISRQMMDGNAQLVIGRLTKTDDGVEEDEQYIPPCMSVNASNNLLDKFTEWKNGLSVRLLNNLNNTLKNIEKVRNPKNKILADAGAALTTSILEKVIDMIPSFVLLREQPFIFTLTAFQQLAWRIKIRLDSLGGNIAQNSLQNYLKESLQINDIQSVIDLIEFKYAHERIDKAVQVIHQFLEFLHKLYDAKTGLPVKNFGWTKYVEETITVFDVTPEEEKRTTG